MENIGFIGLGNMGYPMAKNLEKSGAHLSVYNRTASKAVGLAKKTHVAKSIDEVVNKSDVIFTMLTNDSAVKEVYEAILPLPLKGKLFVDMSTISRDTSLAIAQVIATKNAGFLDAPVAGSTGPAADGTLIIMVGGDYQDLQRATPYLSHMGKTIRHIGENGKGLAAKIAINYFLGAIYQGLAEMTLFADTLGIDRQTMLDIVNLSASGSGATKAKTPKLVEHEFAPAFSLDLMLKDLRLAESAGADFPIGRAMLSTYTGASIAGLGKDDVMGVIRFLAEQYPV
ncbi:NAD(P)-dependent oxidoreductase [Sphingobacterium suaedae]|uniref:NAD(P)-dependent oxidoreductase n=2 Tax=Sphingobacterium suaedae TaxID=1686402 RepID=A0ABW5KIP4_9SPHI